MAPEDWPENRMAKKTTDPFMAALWSALIADKLGPAGHETAWDETPVRIRNISTTGAMIECSAPLRVGAEPLLDLGDAGQVFATVAWLVGDSAGLRFHKPFDLTQLEHARPDVAPAQWDAPSYLQPGPADDSPWDEQWGRMSIGELRQSLEGFMKH